jgi:hypothetical protein
VEDCNNCVANLKRVVDADGCYISDNRRAGVREEGRRESKEKNIVLKSDPQAVKRFEEMFAKMKSGRGVPKELLKRIEKKNVVIEPEELIDGDSPEEITTTEILQQQTEELMEEELDDDDDEKDYI